MSRHLSPGVTYDAPTNRLTVDGVSFDLSMLRAFVADVGRNRRFGPLFLERIGDQIVFHPVQVLDVRILQRCEGELSH